MSQQEKAQAAAERTAQKAEETRKKAAQEAEATRQLAAEKAEDVRKQREKTAAMTAKSADETTRLAMRLIMGGSAATRRGPCDVAADSMLAEAILPPATAAAAEEEEEGDGEENSPPRETAQTPTWTWALAGPTTSGPEARAVLESDGELRVVAIIDLPSALPLDQLNDVLPYANIEHPYDLGEAFYTQTSANAGTLFFRLPSSAVAQQLIDDLSKRGFWRSVAARFGFEGTGSLSCLPTISALFPQPLTPPPPCTTTGSLHPFVRLTGAVPMTASLLSAHLALDAAASAAPAPTSQEPPASASSLSQPTAVAPTAVFGSARPRAAAATMEMSAAVKTESQGPLPMLASVIPTHVVLAGRQATGEMPSPASVTASPVILSPRLSICLLVLQMPAMRKVSDRCVGRCMGLQL